MDHEPSVQLENKHKSEVEIPADHTVDHVLDFSYISICEVLLTSVLFYIHVNVLCKQVAHDHDDSVASSHGSDYTSDELASGHSADLVQEFS